jgi:hypothetical protein
MAPEHHAIQLGGADDLRTFVVRIEVPRGGSPPSRRLDLVAGLCHSAGVINAGFLCSHPVFSEGASKT